MPLTLRFVLSTVAVIPAPPPRAPRSATGASAGRRQLCVVAGDAGALLACAARRRIAVGSDPGGWHGVHHVTVWTRRA